MAIVPILTALLLSSLNDLQFLFVFLYALVEFSDRKGNNKVSKCKLKKYLFEEKKNKEKPANFAT